MLKGGTPIVSLDKVYLSDDDAIFLDCTRMSQSSELVSRKRPNRPNDVLIQIADIVYNLKKDMQRKVFLADDVVFSGDVLRKIVELFQQFGIEVVGIKSSIATKNSYEYFNKNLLYGLEAGYLLEDDVIDQICERDFYFGIIQSGISIKRKDDVFKAPYFKPYGNPVERASIPLLYENSFSQNCIDRSIMLWDEISRLSARDIKVCELPEKIVGTNPDETIVKELKKGKRK